MMGALMLKIIISLLLLSFGARADILIMSTEEARMQGFTEVEVDISLKGEEELPWLKNSLSLPVEPRNHLDPVGNDTVQYQNYGTPYYHGGLDIVSAYQQKVYAPVTGILEGGYYSYTDNPDGSMTKHWKPWPANGQRLYFELAVVTPEGYRFELHHVDPKNLRPETIQALNQGGVSVMAGAELGAVVPWPISSYHHIHYNIVEPNGKIRVNPEWVSELKPDSVNPSLLGVFVQDSKKTTARELTGGEAVSKAVKEVVVYAQDLRRDNGYEHPPARIQVYDSEANVVSGWDFRKRLIQANGQWPPLWDFYLKSILTDKGRLNTRGDYGYGEFLIRLDISKVTSDFYIELEDMNGNITRSEVFSRD